MCLLPTLFYQSATNVFPFPQFQPIHHLIRGHQAANGFKEGCPQPSVCHPLWNWCKMLTGKLFCDQVRNLSFLLFVFVVRSHLDNNFAFRYKTLSIVLQGEFGRTFFSSPSNNRILILQLKCSNITFFVSKILNLHSFQMSQIYPTSFD